MILEFLDSYVILMKSRSARQSPRYHVAECVCDGGTDGSMEAEGGAELSPPL